MFNEPLPVKPQRQSVKAMTCKEPERIRAVRAKLLLLHLVNDTEIQVCQQLLQSTCHFQPQVQAQQMRLSYVRCFFGIGGDSTLDVRAARRSSDASFYQSQKWLEGSGAKVSLKGIR